MYTKQVQRKSILLCPHNQQLNDVICLVNVQHRLSLYIYIYIYIGLLNIIWLKTYVID